MFKISGQFIALLTFPGVVVHEFSHQLGCWLAGVKVLKVRYYQYNNPSGYVIHEKAGSIIQSLPIVLGPLLFGYGAAMGIALIANEVGNNAGGWILLWLVFSIAMHAFPSNDDVNTLWDMLVIKTSYSFNGNAYVVQTQRSLAWSIILFPVGLIIKLFNVLRVVWIDAIIAGMLVGTVVGWL